MKCHRLHVIIIVFIAFLQAWASPFVLPSYSVGYNIQDNDKIEEYLQDELASTAYDKYRSLFFTDSERSKFYEDIRNDFTFRAQINSNPEYIAIYHRCITSDFRKDIPILRYLQLKSSIFSFWIRGYNGDNLALKKKGSTNYFYLLSNGIEVGLLSRATKQNKYIIQICNNEKNYLENLFPLPNCKYVKQFKGGRYIVETNEQGQKTQIEAWVGGAQWTPPPTNTQVKRSILIPLFRHAMNGKNTDGDDITTYIKAPDESGHMIPRQWCGPVVDVGLNLVPQDSSMNHDKKWLSYENDCVELLQSGKKVHLRIKLIYPNKHMRPTRIIRYQENDGLVVCDNVEFDNCEHLRSGEKGLIDKVKDFFTDLYDHL